MRTDRDFRSMHCGDKEGKGKKRFCLVCDNKFFVYSKSPAQKCCSEKCMIENRKRTSRKKSKKYYDKMASNSEKYKEYLQKKLISKRLHAKKNVCINRECCRMWYQKNRDRKLQYAKQYYLKNKSKWRYLFV